MLVYTPVDISFKIPEYDYAEYVRNNHMTNLKDTFGYGSLICPLMSRNPVVDWKDATQVFADSDSDRLYYSPDAQVKFKEILELVHSLPYKQLFGAVLNLHVEELPPHRDEIVNLDIIGPERYNVLLTDHYSQPSFFLCRDKDSEKIYPTILEDYPVYSFSNNLAYHGADIILKDRVILIVGGILDQEKHYDLINQSSEKFKDYAIRF